MQPMTSVIKRAPKGVRCERMNVRFAAGGTWDREGGSRR